MTGEVYCTGPCAGCDETFLYNPTKAPTVKVAGVPKPICSVCVSTANPEREKRGLAPIVVLPSAYLPEPL